HAEFSLIKVGIVRLRIKAGDSQSNLGIVEIGLVITDDKILPLGSDGKGSIETLPAPEKILFRNTRIEQETTTAAISRSDAEGSGGSLLHIHQQINGVRLSGFFCRQLNVFKISGPLKGATALRNPAAGLAFLLPFLQPSTPALVPSPAIPGNQAAVKINRRPFGNHQ